MLSPTKSAIDGQHVDLTAILSQQLSITEVAPNLDTDAKHIALKRMQLDDLTSMDDLSITATFMLDKIAGMTDTEALQILEESAHNFVSDSNFPTEEYDLIIRLIQEKKPGFKCSEDNIEKKIIRLFKTENKIPIENDTQESPSTEESLRDEKTSIKPEVIEVHQSADESFNLESNNSDYYKTVFNWSLQARIEASLITYWSPYPEVRSATVPYDDPTQICETWRAYVAGIIWVGISSFVNQYFAQRYPSISLPASACQVLLYPTGLILSFLPSFDLEIKGYLFQLNPGSWSMKEQMLSSMMVSITSTPYIQGPIYVQRMGVFYGQDWVKWGYQVLLGLSTQFIGFGLAGIVRKFCIYPSKAVWPTILPTVVLNRSLTVKEKKENIHGWTISRYYYFFYVFIGSFIWFWVPGYLFQGLSSFSWMTWIKPDNFNLDVITGFSSGLGFNPISSFDWNVITTASPLTLPAFNQANTALGVLIGFFSIVGVYYSNKYWSANLPVNSSATFNNKGGRYVISKILDENYNLDNEKYQEYGPPFYTAANLVVYGFFFASYPFTFLYTCMTNWGDIVFASKSLWSSLRQFKKSSLEGFDDPHSRMMREYKEVPEWVFLIVLVIALVLGIVAVEIYPTDTPVWGIFFTVAMNFVFLIPFTVLYSITGYQLTMNVLIELIVGYALPGKPNPHLILKAFGTQTDIQAQDYISNQKIGHYAKIPPWAAFRAQFLATIVNLFISLAVINWQIDSFEGLCTPHQAQKFTCASNAEVYFSASVIWGVIGPKRIFDGLYPILKYCFLIGFLLVFPCYAIHRALPLKYKRWFQPAVIIGAPLSYFAPYNVSYFIMGFYLSMIFMVYLRNRYLAWWSKYNYLTTAGLTSGLAICSIILFFSVQYHPKDLNWWGNDIVNKGIDGGDGRPSLLNATLSEGGYFGPRIGNFP